ncbi:cytochrome c3 family protein [Limimaricola cinnabarinus]|uniref:Cytochrome C family protein n=1 Tax=Limimaricola cinnabarinus LL-001 TaxID=1337093 RepID=U2Z9G4_9RHOB|nr:cytochrome c3 family protein [Limimaricola cinnabarinus]GAD57707.1 cytochrome C family protein [Limimaricola cinnabarinus LL-001]
MPRAVILLPALLLGGWSALTLSAQEAPDPTPEQIVEDWLASSHADAMSEAFRHWDGEGEIPGACATCHSTPGFVDYLASPMTTVGVIDHPVPTGTVIECTACHDPAAASLASVRFPSGQPISLGNGAAVCAVCHQGRASGARVEKAVDGMEEDTVSANLGFINIHYSAAAATLMGAEAGGGYEYEGKSYAGRYAHVPGLSDCASCHGPHDTAIEIEDCTTCHAGVQDLSAIRMSLVDYDGDGDTAEGIGMVMQQIWERLLAAIMRYGAEVAARRSPMPKRPTPISSPIRTATAAPIPKKRRTTTAMPAGPRGSCAPPTITSSSRRTAAPMRTTRITRCSF